MAKRAAEIVPAIQQLDDDALSSIKSFGDAIDALSQAGIPIVSSEDVLGDGFTLIPNKDLLIGMTFVIAKARQAMGDHGEFSILHVVTSDDQKFVVTDGSTGIHRQVGEMLSRGESSMLVKGGLHRSEYTYVDADGNEKPAKTYYLS